MIRRRCTIPPHINRDPEAWAKCVRETVLHFVTERRLDGFSLRRDGRDWVATLEGDVSQLPEDDATLAARLHEQADEAWRLLYEVEGDEGFDLRITAAERAPTKPGGR